MVVGKNIKRIRKEKGLTQKKLGELCGINEANIRKYELGGANPKIETVQKIAAALGVTLKDIYGEVTEEGSIVVDLRQVKEKDKDRYVDLIFPELKEENEKWKAEMTILFDSYEKLNELGRSEARKRIQELTKIPEYQKDTE